MRAASVCLCHTSRVTRAAPGGDHAADSPQTLYSPGALISRGDVALFDASTRLASDDSERTGLGPSEGLGGPMSHLIMLTQHLMAGRDERHASPPQIVRALPPIIHPRGAATSARRMLPPLASQQASLSMVNFDRILNEGS